MTGARRGALPVGTTRPVVSSCPTVCVPTGHRGMTVGALTTGYLRHRRDLRANGSFHDAAHCLATVRTSVTGSGAASQRLSGDRPVIVMRLAQFTLAALCPRKRSQITAKAARARWEKKRG